MPVGVGGLVGNPILGLPTLDLFFNWFGVSFDESNAKIATLTFTDGVLTNWMIGGSYLPVTCGFLRYACTSSGGAPPALISEPMTHPATRGHRSRSAGRAQPTSGRRGAHRASGPARGN